MKFSNEAKVGALILGTGFLAVVFAWAIGVQNPFNRSVDFYVTYQFAGGIEVGSPVRVSGIKVGKVTEIDFFAPPEGGEGGAESAQTAPVRLTLSVNDRAMAGVRKNSRFYINMAGIIGERYVEIVPAPGVAAAPVRPGEMLAGVDPPRFDQLISQSFDLAGKISDILEANKGDITRSIELLYRMSENLNEILSKGGKREDFSRLVSNLAAISGDVRRLTAEMNPEEAKKTVALVNRLLWRLEPLDSAKIHDFLQTEGVKIRVF